MSDVVIIAIVAAVPGILTSLIAVYVASKKLVPEVNQTTASTAGTIQDAAIDLLLPYKEEVKTLREHIEILERQVEELKGKIDKLRLELDCVKDERNKVVSGAYLLFHQIKATGAKPVYTPPEYKGGALFDGGQ